MESEFTGTFWGWIGISLLQSVIIIFTLTLGTTWAVCVGERWKAEHTVIDGHCLTFDGNGWQLLGNILKWTLLSIITLGIFSLFIPLKMQKWKTKHTHVYG